MVTLFRQTRLWAVEYRYEGRTRHWLKALPQQADPQAAMQDLLRDLHGSQARLVSVRPATAEEEAAYNRGHVPQNAFCPTGRQPLSRPKPPAGEPD
jgi:hypothetical protein